jgi:RNA polymerase sigma-70 factor (ECF subfamily)
MTERDRLAEKFEAERPRLRAVAYRLLGSPSEAEDAVQEAWLRLNRSDADSIESLEAWLTTVVARVALNMLRSRRSRREEPFDEQLSEPVADETDGADPEHEALVADSVGLALLVVLETLTPPERLAFVLHDMFAVPFDEIAPIVDRSPEAARQLASRARRRVRGVEPTSELDTAAQREVVDAFLAAGRDGDFVALLALLDPDVVLRADMGTGELLEVHGAEAVARRASVYAQLRLTVRPALINGTHGWASLREGRLFSVGAFAVRGGRVVEMTFITNPARLETLELTYLDQS